MVGVKATLIVRGIDPDPTLAHGYIALGNSTSVTGYSTSDRNEIIEGKQASWKVVNPTLKGFTSLKKYYNITKMAGRPVLVDDVFRGAVGSNPSEQFYLMVYAWSADPAINMSALKCMLILDYSCVFTEPAQLTGS